MPNIDFYSNCKFQNSSINNNDIIFISFYTIDYFYYANRLAKSLKSFDLTYYIYEVPSVHRSISLKGNDNLNYTKSSFILHMIKYFNKKIVYIDSDCIVKQFPVLFFEIQNSVDFAIFNWFSKESNNCYKKINHENSLIESSNQLYEFSHSIDFLSDDQLICSGAVQFWSNSIASYNLLKFWQFVITSNPSSADDCCLDLAFNNYCSLYTNEINFLSLPKSYARYAWWIFDQPVIDHPDFPNSNNIWREPENLIFKRYNYDTLIKYEFKNTHNRFHGVIDTVNKSNIFSNQIGERNVSQISSDFWI